MITLHDIILYVIAILPISTLFVNQNISNKVLVVLSIIAFLSAIIRKVRMKNLILLCLLAFEFFISLDITGTFKLYNMNDLFYLPQWVLLFVYLDQYIEESNRSIIKHLKILKLCIYVWEILFVVFRLTDPSMNEEFAHRTASSAFLIIVIVWYISRILDDKKFNFNIIIPLLAVFLLEVRTYLILSMIVVGMVYYSIFKKKRYFFLTIIPMALIAGYLILQTSIGLRFTTFKESYYGGILASITSSRSVFWEADIKAFFNSSLYKKLFGNGYNYIYEINFKTVATYIWGHNDIIHIGVTNGLLGLYIYLYAFYGYVRRYTDRVLIDKRLYYMVISAIAFCALFDGLYHYTCAFYAVPFLFNGLRIYKSSSSGVKYEI